MDSLSAAHSAKSVLCRCSRCDRDRLVLSSLSPRIRRVLRQAINASR
jgi:hypothetical protein